MLSCAASSGASSSTGQIRRMAQNTILGRVPGELPALTADSPRRSLARGHQRARFGTWKIRRRFRQRLFQILAARPATAARYGRQAAPRHGVGPQVGGDLEVQGARKLIFGLLVGLAAV